MTLKLSNQFFRKKLVLLSIGLASFSFLMHGQQPGNPFVDAGADVTIDCGTGGCTDLTATFFDIGETNTYAISSIDFLPPFPFNGLQNSVNTNIDDAWDVPEDLPFTFCFFGDIETQFQVGSNGVVRFDVDPNDTGGGSNAWPFSSDIPNNVEEALAEANILLPGHDIDPSVTTTNEIAWEIVGDAPNRVLAVSYFEVPMFSATCNNLLATQMVVLYETTNIIDVYIQEKPSCPTWNSGNAVIGIQNDAGDLGFVPPGRNTSDSPWTATNEAWRFTPAGPSVTTITWLDSDGNIVGNDTTVNVCPDDPIEVYTAQVVYTNCDGATVTVTDEVQVTSAQDFSVSLGEDLVFCDVPEYEIVPVLTGETTGATYLWSTGETTPTITVDTTGDYSVDVTVGSCTETDDVTITLLTSPCTIDPVCSAVDFLEDFGTGTGRVCDLNGATTTYICNDLTQVDDGQYSITNISDGLNTGWHVGMEDHTEGDVDGRMLFVNADFNPGEFYRRTITLDSNTDYTFNAWITTVYDTDTAICTGTGIPSNVVFRIEDTGGNTISEIVTGDIQNGPEPNWQEFFIAFNTGNNTDIQLVLINNAPGGCGNDLAIDDISLSLNGGQPVVVTPPDLVACDQGNDGVEIFDLETQIPIILDGQNPADFNVSFHTTPLDAQAGASPIDNPDAYSNMSDPETIYVRVEDANEPLCFSAVDFDLTLNEIIDLQTNLPDDVLICSTEPVPTLDATPTNQGIDLNDVTYEWTDSSGTVVSTDATFTPANSDTYTVVITLPPCSENTFVVDVEITQNPTLDLGPDAALCDGDDFEIIPTISGDTQGITYLWSTGETSPTITVDETDTYTLEITVGNCVVTDTIFVEFGELPVIDLGIDFKTCPDEVQIITANVTPEDVTFQWFLNGDLIPDETSNTLEIILPASTVGTQTYTAVASDGGCMSEDSVDVTLYDIGNCVISQGLSPNGDGFNDALDLEFLSDRSGIDQLQIFNRLGTQVYEKINYINEWVGTTTDGEELPTGTYFYVINFTNEDPQYGMQATGWIYLNKEAK